MVTQDLFQSIARENFFSEIYRQNQGSQTIESLASFFVYLENLDDAASIVSVIK
jgi:hypothetical protein